MGRCIKFKKGDTKCIYQSPTKILRESTNYSSSLASDSLSTEQGTGKQTLAAKNREKVSCKIVQLFFFANETNDKVTLQELVINPLHTY